MEKPVFFAGPWIGSFVGSALMFVAGISPKEAASNLSAWVRWFGIDNTPAWLQAERIDIWVFYAGLTILLLSAVLLFRLYRKPIIRVWRSIDRNVLWSRSAPRIDLLFEPSFILKRKHYGYDLDKSKLVRVLARAPNGDVDCCSGYLVSIQKWGNGDWQPSRITEANKFQLTWDGRIHPESEELLSNGLDKFLNIFDADNMGKTDFSVQGAIQVVCQ